MASGASGSSSGHSSSSSSTGSLAKDDSKWYFTAEQLASSPSRKCGMDADQELMYRQRAANLIQDMGQRLQVSQLCINTAIVYMHRFYAFHSFTQFHRNSIAAAAIFLAAKVEEQPRKLEHIIKVVHICLGLEAPDPLKESYAEQAQDLVFNENVLLQTLGFDVAIDHPHTHVVKTCHLVKASKDLAQTSYFMASNSLHLTTMCLQYKPTVVACFCIHLACKWSRWEIPQSNEGRHWFHYVDKTVTLDLLKQLTDEFLHIFDRCPTRLKSKMKSIRADQAQTEDPNRRSTGMPGPSTSIPRGIDDSGSSSSSHHRSSSHSQHSHSKQSSSSGDHALKASQPQTSNHKIPSSSGSSRSRNDRPSSSSQQQLHPPQMIPGGNHYSSSSTSGKMSSSHHSSSRSGMPSQTSSSSSSSSSSRAGYIHDNTRDPKNRIIPNAVTGSSSSSMQMHPYNQSKMDRHLSSNSSSSSQKGQSLSQVDNKNPLKGQSSMMGSLFNSSQELTARTSSSSLMKQPATNYGSHPPSYTQSMSNRSTNLPSTEPASVLNQQQQFKSNLQQQQSTSSESSFRLIDDSNRLVDPMPICTPPKQSKPSSIFSPEWKDTQTENNTNLSNPSGSSGKSRSHVPSINANTVKPIKDSPGNRDKKPLLPSYSDLQQQKRSETPKKERRSEPVSATHQKTSDKKSIPSGMSSKRSLESTGSMHMSSSASNLNVDQADILGINKLSSNSVPIKRTHPNSEQVRQEDGTDFRESKMRKVEHQVDSTDHLFGFTCDIENTFDKNSDVFSSLSFNDPGSLSSQPLLSDSKPITTSKTYSSTTNGIETDPILISRLLNESLCSTESKFGTLNTSSSNTDIVASTLVVTTNSLVTGGTSSLSSMAPSSGSVLTSLSGMNTSSTKAVLDVPETTKIEASSLDDNSSKMNTLHSKSSSVQNVTATAPALPTSAQMSSVVSATNSSANSNVSAGEVQTLTGDALSLSGKDDEHHRSKSEKKKKKEKHKHKEKSKTKEKSREERKKHKKDKDRSRDREKSEHSSDPAISNPPPAPIKIKLQKDKLNLTSLSETSSSNPAESGLKIKIPKDRLSGASAIGASASGSTTSSGSSTSLVGTSGYSSQPPNPLKLKISKDKIENYNISTGSDSNQANLLSHTGTNVIASSSSSGHHSHSSKKKDRDKTKSSKSSTSASSHDYKQNGNGGSSTGGQTGNSSSKSSSSSKQNIASTQQAQYSLYNATQLATSQSGSITHHPASFDFMQHAQAPTLQQQQQYFNQFNTFNTQQSQQQQLMINNSAMKMTNLGTTLPSYYYGPNNQNNSSSTGKK